MEDSEIMSLEESISEEIVSMNPMSIVEDFSDEILLKIFSFLDSEDIVNCVPVHEKFRRIAFDDFLWRGCRQFGKANLSDKLVPLGLIQELFNQGTKFLNLEGATIFTQIKLRYLCHNLF